MGFYGHSSPVDYNFSLLVIPVSAKCVPGGGDNSLRPVVSAVEQYERKLSSVNMVAHLSYLTHQHKRMAHLSYPSLQHT